MALIVIWVLPLISPLCRPFHSSSDLRRTEAIHNDDMRSIDDLRRRLSKIGHTKLARQMYPFDDLLCLHRELCEASRPSCPPITRVIATKDEEDNALKYGLPSSHTLNTICLSGYLFFICYPAIRMEITLLRSSGLLLFAYSLVSLHQEECTWACTT